MALMFNAVRITSLSAKTGSTLDGVCKYIKHTLGKNTLHIGKFEFKKCILGISAVIASTNLRDLFSDLT